MSTLQRLSEALTPASLRLLVYHYAGHAVARWASGIRTKSIAVLSLDPHLDLVRGMQLDRIARTGHYASPGKRTARLHSRVIVMIAGAAAEKRFDFNESSCLAQGDCENAIRILRRLHAPEVVPHVYRYLEAEAQNLFADPETWRMTQSLAERLMGSGSMAAGDVDRHLFRVPDLARPIAPTPG